MCRQLVILQKKTEVPLYRGPVTKLVIPAFQACMQSALFRANIKPPVELVVANLGIDHILLVLSYQSEKIN